MSKIGTILKNEEYVKNKNKNKNKKRLNCGGRKYIEKNIPTIKNTADKTTAFFILNKPNANGRLNFNLFFLS
ncbi:hypothetical protein SDC9_87354 [bioreactor metagenome]|uniref:Uncharacterized protein n=1 Tax=bioreactor metagenome TaxID=1076179 RepID=A0A644ZIM7_9ZZZZ